MFSTTPAAIERRRHREAQNEGPARIGSKKQRTASMIAIDKAYLQTAPRTTTQKCCGKCRTPFSICAAKDCRCHQH